MYPSFSMHQRHTLLRAHHLCNRNDNNRIILLTLHLHGANRSSTLLRSHGVLALRQGMQGTVAVAQSVHLARRHTTTWVERTVGKDKAKRTIRATAWNLLVTGDGDAAFTAPGLEDSFAEGLRRLCADDVALPHRAACSWVVFGMRIAARWLASDALDIKIAACPASGALQTIRILAEAAGQLTAHRADRQYQIVFAMRCVSWVYLTCTLSCRCWIRGF